MFKRGFLAFLTMMLVLALFPNQQASASAFSDVPTSHAYYQEITYLLEKGVISNGSKYGVDDKVTREEVAVMVAKAVGLEGTQTETKFSDVPEERATSGYINSAVEAGIINGYPDGTFKPDAKVTRGHMAAFIARGFKLQEQANVTFKDVPNGTTAFEPVRKLAHKKITTGYEDGTFKPDENLSRAHISVFLARAMGFQKVEVKPAPTPKPTPVPKPVPKPVVKPTPKPVVKPAPKPVVTKPVQTGFKNCTELRKVYPSGVAKGHPAYQSKMDRDKDGWACE